jgi:hypothetical protein
MEKFMGIVSNEGNPGLPEVIYTNVPKYLAITLGTQNLGVEIQVAFGTQNMGVETGVALGTQNMGVKIQVALGTQNSGVETRVANLGREQTVASWSCRHKSRIQITNNGRENSFRTPIVFASREHESHVAIADTIRVPCSSDLQKQKKKNFDNGGML